MKLQLPPLPYPSDALEPYLDAQTMEIHHDKHHGTYVAKLNNALSGHPELAEKNIEELLANLDDLPENVRQAVRNHGGGHYHHSIFWLMLRKPGPEPSPAFKKEIERSFGNWNNFQKQFLEVAANLFGSGWSWLTYNPRNNTLQLTNTPNQDSPLTQDLYPLLGIDLWEHAYYLKYQSRRAEYSQAWWKVINWDQVAENLASARNS